MSTDSTPQSVFLARFAEASLRAKSEGAVVNSLAACAQGALESGWGTSELAIRCNNVFGVKANPQEPNAWLQWTWEYGTVATVRTPGADVPNTTGAQQRQVPGGVNQISGYYRTQAWWRHYASYSQALLDYAKIIGGLSWYAHAIPHADPPHGDGNATLWLAGLMWPGLPRWSTTPAETYVADVTRLFPSIGDWSAHLMTAAHMLAATETVPLVAHPTEPTS